jgi:hypothetical protein
VTVGGMANVARPSLWSRARAMAEKTPPRRNRYVDFLRAYSILAVVTGHWLVAAPYMEEGAVQGGHLLGILPWTQWLTWGFQVMPIFFLVGGYSSGTSWSANLRDGKTYSDWLGGRLERLIKPVLPLFLIWALFAMFGTSIGVERRIVGLAAQLALIPVWFLAVYLIVTALVPLTFAAWRKLGMLSFWLFVFGAIAVDIATLRYRVPHINFANFAFVWLAITQLGYAWHEGYFTPGKALLWGLGGLAVLGGLVGFGPYPVAMIGVPGNEITNSMPPTLALLALGVMQTGLALALEPVGRRMLRPMKAWTGVVLMNGMIMTVYLWHLTAFILVMLAAWLLGGTGLHVVPGSAAWWLARPIWFALYIAALLPLVMLFARYERASGVGDAPGPPAWRKIAGLLLICAGLAASAAISIASPNGVTGVRLWVVALPFVGAALAGFGPLSGAPGRQR